MFSVSELIPPLAEYSYQWILFFSIMVIALVYILYRLYSSISATPKTVSFDVPSSPKPKLALHPTNQVEEDTVKAANDIDSSVLTSIDEIDNGLLIPTSPKEDDGAEPEVALDDDQGTELEITQNETQGPSEGEDETQQGEHEEVPPEESKEEGPKKRKSRSKKIPV